MGDLSRNQAKAIQALLTCPTVAQAATKAGLSERTIYNYLADAAFRQALTEAQSKILAATVAGLVGIGGLAVKNLQIALTAISGVDTKTKLTAARIVLDQTAKLTTFAQLEQRLQSLEAAIDAQAAAAQTDNDQQ
ncbi:MAG: hypothetical protein DRI81_07220 [Chloroflexi bacterium]|nr:MAG: hypothetical protein DRI81_07220 [Chloroflexota bacterium]